MFPTVERRAHEMLIPILAGALIVLMPFLAAADELRP